MRAHRPDDRSRPAGSLRRLARPVVLGVSVLAASALVALPGCETTELFQGNPDAAEPAEADWAVTEPFAAASDGLVWERMRIVLAGEGYRFDDTRTRWEDRLLVTDWLAVLAPVRFEGFRRRVHAKIVPAGEGRFAVRLAVIRQRNADMDQPMNAIKAQWERTEPDVSRTALLVWKVRNAFTGETSGAPSPAPGAMPASVPGK